MKINTLKCAVALAVFCATGCESLSADSAFFTAEAPTDSTHCDNPDTGDTELCELLESVSDRADDYIGAADQTAYAYSFFSYQQAAAALSIVGFSFFDAHPDNTRAATLIGAAGNLASTQLKPNARNGIFVDGAQSLKCVHDRASSFLDLTDENQGLRDSLDDFSTELRARRYELADIVAQAAAPVDQTNVNQAFLDLEEEIDAASELLAAREAAPEKVRDTLLNIESTAESLLKQQSVNVSALVESISQLPTGATTGSDGAGGGIVAAAAVGGTDQQKIDWLEAITKADTVALNDMIGSPGSDELQAIATCVDHFD